jgi:hypothetical protein
MTPTTVTVDVDRPADEVFAYAIYPTHFHEWQNGVIAGRMDRPGLPEVGDHCVTTRRIGGAERPSTSAVVRINAPQVWSVRGIDGPIRASVDLDVEPITETRSRLTVSVDFQGHGIGKVLVPLLVRRQAAEEMPTNVRALKARLERAELL